VKSRHSDFVRRTFLKGAAFPLFWRVEGSLGKPRPESSAMEQVLPGLQLLKGSVNSALLERKGQKLLIDSGEIEAAPGGGVIDWAFFTHHHRDQCSSVSRLAATGTKVAVPVSEKHFFDEAHRFWDSADNILDHRYDFRPHLFTMRESVPVTRAVKGGDVHEWEGLKFQVIDTPGHTDGSVTYLVELGAKRVAFTGDLISGPGQIWEIYSLQKRFPGMRGDYWGFGGAVEEVKASLDRVLQYKPDLLIPSHGRVMADPVSAVNQLKQNLDALMENYLATAAWRIYFAGIYPKDKPPMFQPLPKVTYPNWIRDIASTTKAIVAEDKSVFISDCGHPKAVEELSRLQAAGEIGAVEGIWITHYHDDHTQQVNEAKRRFGAKVYVQREMLDIIENPMAYQMPCLFPESIRVDHPMEHGQTIDWKGFKLTAYDFPGQTVYHDGLLVEKDGFKVFFTGDSFANWGVDDYCSQNRCFLGRDTGYEKCFKILLETQPNILMAAHWGPLPVSPEYLTRSLTLLRERATLYQKLFPHSDVNFGTDPCWIRAYPYRQTALPRGLVGMEARVMNHSAKPMKVRVTLNLPEGWKSSLTSGETQIPARTEGRIRLHATAPSAPDRRRHVLGISAVVDGHPVGEFAEAIVNFLGGKAT
jgi:glyoxylase-like metal-dependent hydrolase (beta-lactamase superfamily II)